MFGYGTGITQVTSGKSNGRSIYQPLMKGRITITGEDGEGKSFQRIVEVLGGEVWDNILKVDGKTVHRIAYGQFEKVKGPEGRELVSFKKGTGKGKHGKAYRDEKLFGHAGRCHSWYKNGRLIRQKFIYDNRRVAYNYNAYRQECIIKDPDGAILYEVKGALRGGLNNTWNGCHSVFAHDMREWFIDSKPFEVKKKGKVFYAGEWNHFQKVGRWVENGKVVNYVNGVAIPWKLFVTPSEKLDPAKLLRIDNAQLRMAMMDRVSGEQIAKAGKVVHKDGDMRLYDIQKLDVRILRVRCNTTKVFYYLKVPKDATKCEEARQWTFGVGQDFREPIKFAVET